MRFLIQSVQSASVLIEKEAKYEEINRGILIYVAISNADLDDYQSKIAKFVSKITKTRCLKGDDDEISQSLEDIKGEILLISNFTLYGNNKKGAKMSFTDSAPFGEANKIYDLLLEELKKTGFVVKSGIFGAMMDIKSQNIGPLNYVWDL
ncbi:D-aminoacyl-tRNA deacylase [Candidatus Gracilibacteria bacterium]|nr:D-aminoacyl-tRNA deacylase [Candidatus Gracilibacteria bacterium]